MKDMPQIPPAIAMGNVLLDISLDSTTHGTTLSAVFTIARLTLTCLRVGMVGEQTMQTRRHWKTEA